MLAPLLFKRSSYSAETGPAPTRTVDPQVDHASAPASTTENATPSGSLSVFPSFFNKYHSDSARQKILARVDSKDQYRISDLLTKDQALALFVKLQSQLTGLRSAGINLHLSSLIESLNTLDNQTISFEQWADMSLRLENLSDLLKRHANEDLPSLAYIRHIVTKLESVSRYTWKQQAHERIIEKFEQAFVKLIRADPAANYVRNLSGTLQAQTPLGILSAGGSAGYEVSFGFDDEGYGKTYSNLTGDFGVNFKFPFFKMNGQSSGLKGEYNYCRTARDHAICYFNQLLANNPNAPELSAYLSRRRTLGLQDTSIEVDDFYAAQKDYVLTEKTYAKAFSLFLSLDYSGELVAIKQNSLDIAIPSRKLKHNQAIEHAPQITPNAEPVEGNKKKAVVINGKIDTIRRSGFAKFGLETPIYDGSATLKGESSERTTQNTRYATLCDLLDNPYANSNPTFKKKLKDDIQKAGLALRKKMQQSWYSTPHAAHDAAACARFAAMYREFPGGFKKDLLIQLIQEPDFNRLAPNALPALIDDVRENATDFTRSQFIALMRLPVFRQKNQATLLELVRHYQAEPEGYTQEEIAQLRQIPGLLDIAPTLYLPSDINRLSNDLAFLEKLHAQRSTGQTDVDASIHALYKIYGADNAEECLKNMAVLAAWFYELLGDKKPEALSKRIKNLETGIYATGIPHDPDQLRKLAGASQKYYSITSDKTVEFSLKNEFRFSFARTTAPGLGFKANRKNLMHYNPSRSGKSYNFEITLSGKAGPDRRILQALAGYLNNEGAYDLSELFNSGYFANLSAQGTFSVKYFLPKDPGAMQMVKLDQRLISQLGFEISPSIPIGIPHFGHIAIGVNYSGSMTSLLKDMPSSETMFYFNMHYMHALFTGTIPFDRKTLLEDRNEKGQDSYWHVLVRKHGEVLKQLFRNIAQQKLTAEFDHLRRRYLSYEGVSAEEHACVKAAQQNLITCAMNFHSTGREKDYLTTLEAFKEFMRVLFKHWMWTRELSEAFEPFQYEFHLSSGLKRG